MPSVPLVSVVMPVRNAEAFVAEAMTCILNQTWTNLEFIVVDDASEDSTADILADFQRADSRVRVVSLPARHGIAAALNRGCCLCRGEFIARMDADDISYPDRLEKQIALMSERGDIGVLGTWVQTINAEGVPLEIWRLPSHPDELKWMLLFRNCLAHPTVLMRRELVARLGFYRSDIRYAQDYDLWIRASTRTRLANLKEPLLQYRVWPGSTSVKHASRQNLNVARLIQAQLWQKLQIGIGIDAAIAIWKLTVDYESLTDAELSQLASVIPQVYRAYCKTPGLSAHELAFVRGDTLRMLDKLRIHPAWRGTAAVDESVLG